jgi:hypothetical protein
VAEDDDVGPPAQRRLGDRLDALRAVLERQRGLGADGAARGQAHVGDDDVRAGVGHGLGLGLVEHVRRGQHVLGASQPDQVDLQAVAHAGLLEVLADLAVEEAHGREVLDAGEAQGLEVVEERVEQAEGVGAVDAASTGVRLTTGRTSRAISTTMSFALP